MAVSVGSGVTSSTVTSSDTTDSASDAGVAATPGINNRSPTRIESGSPRPFAAMISTTVTPKDSAIRDRLSPSRTTYVIGSGVGVAVAVGVAVGVAEGVGEGSV